MVKELLKDDGVESIHPKLESHRINLVKQQKEIESLYQDIAQRTVGGGRHRKGIF